MAPAWFYLFHSGSLHTSFYLNNSTHLHKNGNPDGWVVCSGQWLWAAKPGPWGPINHCWTQIVKNILILFRPLITTKNEMPTKGRIIHFATKQMWFRIKTGCWLGLQIPIKHLLDVLDWWVLTTEAYRALRGLVPDTPAHLQGSLIPEGRPALFWQQKGTNTVSGRWS